MLNQTNVVRLGDRVKRVAFTVSVVYILGLLLVATAVLGVALGGSVLGFVVALVLIGALSVLVLNVVVSVVHQVAIPTVEDGSYSDVRSSKFAA